MTYMIDQKASKTPLEMQSILHDMNMEKPDTEIETSNLTPFLSVLITDPYFLYNKGQVLFF